MARARAIPRTGLRFCTSADRVGARERCPVIFSKKGCSLFAIYLLLQINFKSGKPVYLQIVDQIKAASASGALQPGEALPSHIRGLAEELRVNRNTIAKAYAELENLGVIETIPGKGCFARATAVAASQRQGCGGRC